MKLNFYRKVTLAFFSICIFITCILFVPFYNTTTTDVGSSRYGFHEKKITTIVYEPIWASGVNINSQRLLIEIFMLIVFFGILFVFLGKLKNPDFKDKKTVKILLRESLLFLMPLLISIVYYVIYLADWFPYNYFGGYFLLLFYFLIYPIRFVIMYGIKLHKFLKD